MNNIDKLKKEHEKILNKLWYNARKKIGKQQPHITGAQSVDKRLKEIERVLELLDPDWNALKQELIYKKIVKRIHRNLHPWKWDVKAGFGKITIPLIRRVFPNLIANDLVSVQPMTGPIGVAFNLKVV